MPQVINETADAFHKGVTTAETAQSVRIDAR